MKSMLIPATVAAALIFSAGIGRAASFSYHGNLQDSGKPAEGNYDIELTLYSAPSGGSVIGGPLIMHSVPVHGGSFSTEADFGPLSKSFSHAYVGTSVRSAGQEAFVDLNARTQVSTTIAANVCPGAWTLEGNAGNPAGSYLGTADNLPLTFAVNALQAGQITPSGDSTNYPDAANVIFGSPGNSIDSGTNAAGATIGGGGSTSATCGPQTCINTATAAFATVSGGEANRATSLAASVGGGQKNTASGIYASIAGGQDNTASQGNASVGGGGGNTASGPSATVGGGNQNTASANNSTISGGDFNVASGASSTVAGGFSNQAGGDNSFAAGHFAVVRDAVMAGNSTGDHGSFVWADDSSSFGTFTSTGPNQFLMRATGGVGINTATIPGGVLINTSANGANLTTGGAWTNGSSRMFKEGFAAIDPGAILAKVVDLPIMTWRYKQSAEGTHLGPVAEDFKTSFDLGGDAQHIATVDEEGVALGAIQGLNEKVEKNNSELRDENAALRAQLGELAARLAKLETKKGE